MQVRHHLTMHISTAEYRDVRAWLDIASEVEPLFGDLLGGPRFMKHC